MAGRSTSVPCTCVDQFWFPAMTWPREFTPAATYWTPGTCRSEVASSAVSVVAMPAPWRTPADWKLPELMLIRLVPADLTCSSIVACAPRPSATIVMTAPTPMIIPSMVRMVRILLRLSAFTAIRSVMNIDMVLSYDTPPRCSAGTGSPTTFWRSGSGGGSAASSSAASRRLAIF
jgi:hypothetical protein